jgi:hypothetical protein
MKILKKNFGLINQIDQNMLIEHKFIKILLIHHLYDRFSYDIEQNSRILHCFHRPDQIIFGENLSISAS